MEYTKEDVEKFIKKIADLEASVANFETAEKALKTELDSLKGNNSNLTNTIAGLTEANEAYKVKVSKLEGELSTSTASLAKANEDLAVFAQEKVKASRLQLFNDVEIEDAKAQDLVNKFISLSDEQFNDIVAAMPKKKTEVKKEAEAEKVLDTAKVETTIASVIPPQDTTKQTRESASAWLKSNMNSNKEKK